MAHWKLNALALILVTTPLGAQLPADSDEPVRVGPGVTPPRLIHRVEPEYSSEALNAGVQGTVVLQLVVTEKGRAADVSVISPLGFGLDERAEAAVEKWEFVPGMKAGAPVKILGVVETNFRLQGRWFDESAERRRTVFNETLRNINRTNANPADVERGVKSILDLSRQKFAPGMFVAGLWKTKGEHVPKDVVEGLDLIQKAAIKNYGPAIYEVAIRRIDGRDLLQDVDKGLQEMREAATLGSQQAQFYLGNRYEKGMGVPLEIDRARRYYRLCASQGVALCQYRLGRLIYDAPNRRERDYLEAIALFQLASAQGLAEATQLASAETPKLSAEQVAWVANLKRQIVRK